MKRSKPKPLLYRARAKRALYVASAAQCGALLLAGMLLSGLVLIVLEGWGLSPTALVISAWVSFCLVAGASATVAVRWLRPGRTREDLRRTLIEHFPDQRKEFDAWLAQELIGADEKAVRRILVERLDGSLPDGKAIVPPEELPRLRVGLVAALALPVLIGFAMGLSPVRVLDRYLGGLFGRYEEARLVITGVEPADGWVRPGVATRLRIRFDREFRVASGSFKKATRPGEEDGRVRLVPGERTYPLLRAGEGAVYETVLPPLSRDCRLVVEAEGRTSAPIEIRVFPEDVLELLRATATSPRGGEATVLRPQDFPVSLDDGARIEFELGLRDCPVRSAGFSGHFGGEVPLVRARPRRVASLEEPDATRPAPGSHSGRARRYAVVPGGVPVGTSPEASTRLSATVTVRADEIYSLWWTYPDGTRRKKGFFPVRRKRPGAPRVRLVAPHDGARILPDRPVRVEVECEHELP
ncbi:MAG: hypothetical protein ACYSU0_06990, partial [Planctomycetota bacterium]